MSQEVDPKDRDRKDYVSFTKKLPRAALSRLYAADMHYISELPANEKDLEAIYAFIRILRDTANRMTKELEEKEQPKKEPIEITRTIYLGEDKNVDNKAN
jgi:hypothetical protein